MSTQLVLYPQNYNGYSSTNNAREYVVDGYIFSSINSVSTSQGTLPTGTGTSPLFNEMLTNYPASIVNKWYTFRSDGAGAGGVPTYPTQTGNQLVLVGASSWSWAGVYQRLSNITEGQSYTVTVDIIASATVDGNLIISTYLGTPLGPIVSTIFNQPITSTATSTTYTVNFTATNWSQPTGSGVMVTYYATNPTGIKVEKISVKEAVGNPSLVYSDLLDGQVICDLYQEEEIPLTLSVDEFKNVAEKVQSYSKDFNLPATKRNNQIFNNMFEITRADDGLIFNPYIQTKCALKQDGFLLFEGYLKMLNIKEKEGEISYNVNLYSEVIALADILKNKTFAELDLSELTHVYDKQSIKDSMESPGIELTNPLTDPNEFAGPVGATHTEVIKYPFIDWTHQFIVGGTGDANANIGCPELDLLEQAFRPCIQVKYLMSKIFADADFRWTSNFLNTTVAGGGTFDFDKLYMDFNWGSDEMPTARNKYNATWYRLNVDPPPANPGTGAFKEFHLIPETTAGGEEDSILPPNYDASTNVITATTTNEFYSIKYAYRLENESATTAHDYSARWLHTTAAGIEDEIDLYESDSPSSFGPIQPEATVAYRGGFTVALNTGDTLSAQFKAPSDVGQTVRVFSHSISRNTVQFAVTNASTTSEGLLTLRGELGQWDFIKGIFTMFNLITMVDESNAKNILIEPYGDIFIKNTNSGNENDLSLRSRSIQHDWTDKVDVSQMELKPLTDLNKNTIFKFVEDEDDYAFNVYKQANFGRLYGSLEHTGEGFTILEGTKEITAEPFAATLSKPLMWNFPDFIVPTIYAMGDEGETEGFENSPRIFYNNGKKPTGTTYFMPPQNGQYGEDQPNYLQFSHLTDVPSVVSSPPAVTDTIDFVFESANIYELGLGNAPTDNLYRTYWQPYFNELYNADTRIMILKVNLTPSDIATFKFYDKVMIKNRTFRVNKIEYKPNSLAKVEFILIG